MAEVQRMSVVQRVAQIFGWGFVAAGIGGFLATGASMEAHSELAPKLLGLFPVNVLHNVVHLVLGVFGIAAAKNFTAAKHYCRIAGFLYAILAGLGAVSPDMFGLVPIGGNDIWLHLLFAIPLLLFGLIARDTPRATDVPPPMTAGRG